jgi:hypothetical protein
MNGPLRQAQGERIKTGRPFDTVRPEALEGTNGAQDRSELVEPQAQGEWIGYSSEDS